MDTLHEGHREHMRQRFLATGLNGFADHEALELLLYYALPRQDTNPIVHRLIRRYGSLQAVLSAPIEDLQAVEGIGQKAALLLKLAPALCQKAKLQEAEREIALSSSQAAGAYALTCFENTPRETVFLFCLDRKARLLASRKLTEGTSFAAGLDIRRVVEAALLSSASGVILAHNHPSGLALPSGEDVEATARVRAALDTVGIQLIDHLVVADGDYVSMAESGCLAGAAEE